MLIPIRHENMSARRWPVVTLALIVINTVVFLATHDTLLQQAPELGKVKAHILILAATHPELTLAAEEQRLVTAFKDHNPTEWAKIQDPNHKIIDAWDGRIRLVEEQSQLQQEMDSLAERYAKLSAASLAEQYAFVPAHPKPLAYLTANFLHGGWLHLIGNMWFLWLAGFVLEDAWGRPLYTAVYLVAGAVALQFHAWLNPGSIVPTLGASGAVAALMGAFLVSFPKMKIEMMWIIMFRRYTFKAPAYALLPLWLLMEVLYGTLFGSMSGTAHWAHVGGFLFGVVAALAIRYSGLEHKMNQAIEEEVSWQNDPEILQASEMVSSGQLDEALPILKDYLARKPDSVDACSLLREIHWRKNDIPLYLAYTERLCSLHLAGRQPQAAWQDYEEFVQQGGVKLPAQTWLDLCRVPEAEGAFERALSEYQKLAAAYPSERQSLMAQLGVARIYLKRLNRPKDALRLYEAVASSPIPHLDLEPNIQSGLREARAALAAPAVPAEATS
jgi:membrane associated rhomboid family serine protease